jgi:hypothetical protein
LLERALIQEVVQHANDALSDELEVIRGSAEKLDFLEEENNLNEKMSFNNHLLFNRLIQVIY